MVEYLTEAIVLDKRPDKNLDVVLTIFSRDLGKVYGKATSSRKITSRLASHLEPGTLAKVRLARRGVGDNFRIIEALTEARRADPETARFLMFLDKMAPIG
ncbi:MAG: recombination protein O N-terminal domain-containing protein [Patescibacteria group bacterium]|nr:recombination protein O N-terminal domain-containing protein [Patescibacteria group bacterium]